ncbi:hypothetical protein PV755_38015 [Streptomyces caniscabiei]|uniref:Uncharacterized protein n=1 Tax=Streptomyces caniscabiei TaxID=2746961 RepID=A0A927LC88_9ACTN|nr:hypothetical protein [Streptomyces caniscabiei]MBD9729109.1 hypothetical protein [Streptomyces caniscabiei]MDX3514642.1 hypothetical protein [Streptomyces caniscabiei]MDX3723918.1 hypothetical protein [Streptomyces caniscabiei]WEO23854.1 hypothetical protein IHE65_12070 [Streptomyces caniscabiei]
MTSSQASSHEIIALANAQLEKAAKGYKASRWLQVATFVLSVTSVFITNPLTYIPALIALGVQVSSWVTRNRAAKCHSAGEEGRIRGLLLDALGTIEERVDLNNWFGRVTPPAGETHPAPVPSDYFASAAPLGMKRLCDHLQENAFWGKQLYKSTADYYGRMLWVFSIVSVGVILIAIPITSDENDIILARLIVVALASGAAFTQLTEVMAWRSAESKSEILDRRLDSLATFTEEELSTSQIGTVLSAYGDYCIATSGAPPVPSWIYLRQKDRVNALWARRGTI